jgi:hypothetical protein
MEKREKQSHRNVPLVSILFETPHSSVKMIDKYKNEGLLRTAYQPVGPVVKCKIVVSGPPHPYPQFLFCFVCLTVSDSLST